MTVDCSNQRKSSEFREISVTRRRKTAEYLVLHILEAFRPLFQRTVPTLLQYVSKRGVVVDHELQSQ